GDQPHPAPRRLHPRKTPGAGIGVRRQEERDTKTPSAPRRQGKNQEEESRRGDHLLLSYPLLLLLGALGVLAPWRLCLLPLAAQPALVPAAMKSSDLRATDSGTTLRRRRPRRTSAQFFRISSACRLAVRAW